MKRAVVCGAGGLLGAHMAKRLKSEGYFVRGLGRSPWHQPTNGFCFADEYWCCDLHQPHPQFFGDMEEIYQFACEVGGLGYIADSSNDLAMLRNSTQIDLAILDSCEARKHKVFFASSACVYPAGNKVFKETDVSPEQPSNAFARQKLFAEKLYQASGLDVRIGRLFNCYGRGMTWWGGREKAVAAICRKVAETEHMHGTIEIWGNGDQRRSFLYVDDAIEGIRRLMQSDFSQPINIGPTKSYSVSELVQLIGRISGKHFVYKYVDGPTGVPSICCDTTLLKQTLDWEPATTLEEGLKVAYPWVEQKVLARQLEKA